MVVLAAGQGNADEVRAREGAAPPSRRQTADPPRARRVRSARSRTPWSSSDIGQRRSRRPAADTARRSRCNASSGAQGAVPRHARRAAGGFAGDVVIVYGDVPCSRPRDAAAPPAPPPRAGALLAFHHRGRRPVRLRLHRARRRGPSPRRSSRARRERRAEADPRGEPRHLLRVERLSPRRSPVFRRTTPQASSARRTSSRPPSRAAVRSSPSPSIRTRSPASIRAQSWHGSRPCCARTSSRATWRRADLPIRRPGYVEASVTIGADTVIGLPSTCRPHDDRPRLHDRGQRVRHRLRARGRRPPASDGGSRRGEGRQRCDRRAVRAAAARRGAARGRPHRQNFVEVKKPVIGAGTKANHLGLSGRRDDRPREQHRCGHDHPQLRRVSRSTARSSATARRSAATASWWRRTIGDDAYVATGTTLRHDVEPGALAFNPKPDQRAGWSKASASGRRRRRRAERARPRERPALTLRAARADRRSSVRASSRAATRPSREIERRHRGEQRGAHEPRGRNPQPRATAPIASSPSEPPSMNAMPPTESTVARRSHRRARSARRSRSAVARRCRPRRSRVP